MHTVRIFVYLFVINAHGYSERCEARLSMGNEDKSVRVAARSNTSAPEGSSCFRELA